MTSRIPAGNQPRIPDELRPRLIDGRQIAVSIEDAVEADVRELKRAGTHPHLVTLQIGRESATELYTRNQERRFKRLGIRFTHLCLDTESDLSGILSHIHSFNDNPTITGIMVTMPLPSGIDVSRIKEQIRPEKDVEGVSPFNLGNLIYDREGVGPCSALAVLEAIRSTGVTIEGANAVVVGHSDIVGKPVTLCLLHDLATTTTCHIATRDLAARTRQADILVVAVGKPELITADMVKEGAVVIDVGINEVPDGDGGTRIVGDVAFEPVARKASRITPVPGGIGPITVAMLARNTVLCTRTQLR